MGNLPRLLSGEFDNLHVDIAQFTALDDQIIAKQGDVAGERPEGVMVAIVGTLD